MDCITEKEGRVLSTIPPCDVAPYKNFCSYCTRIGTFLNEMPRAHRAKSEHVNDYVWKDKAKKQKPQPWVTVGPRWRRRHPLRAAVPPAPLPPQAHSRLTRESDDTACSAETPRAWRLDTGRRMFLSVPSHHSRPDPDPLPSDTAVILPF